MKFYLDSAQVSEAQTAANWGWVEGITTNPTLLAQSAEKPEDTLRKLAALVRGPLFYQVTQKRVSQMVLEAQRA